ncbi:MAG: CPBP family intramembrane glutamic endopeptidase [Eubacteriales bacterium]
MKRKTAIYLIISFGWTWTCWIGAFIISRMTDYTLITDATIFETLGYSSGRIGLLPQVLFALGVYGPMIGCFAVKREKSLFKLSRLYKYTAYALFIPIIIIVPTVILSAVFNDAEALTLTVAGTISLYFLSNFLTSGTEEFGWRGYLYPYLKQKEATFWSATWKGGLIWAVWHYPLLVILYIGQGLAVLIPSVAGFTAGIVAMNYITNFIYEKTESVPVVMLLHALNNTVSFAVLFIFPGTPFLFIMHLMSWAAVGYLEKKYHLT